MSETLKEKTAKGLFWGAINSGSMQVLNILFGIMLGRLLSPDDYGIVGLLAVFTAVAGNIQDSGFAVALINQKETRKEDFNSVFWFNILASITLYVILFFCAPLIADYFSQPALTTLARVLFLAFIVSSVGIAHGAYLTKHLMNREKAIISISALLVSGGIGMTLAFKGYGYWSLAWQQIIYNIVILIGRLYYTPWHPTLNINFEPVKRMFSFSYKILITMIINSLSENVLTFIFGRLYPIRSVGYFSQAHHWDCKAHSFVNMTIAQVAQPVLASINDEKERQQRVFRKMLRFTVFLSFPCLFGLAIVADEFIILTLSEKWKESVALLQILCISGAFEPVYILYHNLAISRGRSDIYLWCTALHILILIAIIIALHNYGILVMVIAYSAFHIAWLGVWQVMAHRLIGLRLRDVLRDIAPFLLITLSIMATTYLITNPIENMLLLLIARILIAGGLYIAVMKILKVKIMEEVVKFFFHRK